MSILQRRLVRVAAAAAVAVIGWGGILVAPTGASAAIVTINSTVHGFAEDFPLDGTADILFSNVVRVGNSSLGPFEDRGIIEFDISGLTGSVALAELSLASAPNPNPFLSTHTVNVLGYTGNGGLDLADFSAGSFLTSFSYFNEANVTFDVTAFINAQIATADPWAGFVLLMPAATPDFQIAIFGNSQSGFGDISAFPKLNVTTVPLPAALPLFLSALAGLGLMGWRRRRQAGA